MTMMKSQQEYQRRGRRSSSSSSRRFLFVGFGENNNKYVIVCLIFAFVCIWSVITLLKSTTQILQIISLKEDGMGERGEGGGGRNCVDNDKDDKSLFIQQQQPQQPQQERESTMTTTQSQQQQANIPNVTDDDDDAASSKNKKKALENDTNDNNNNNIWIQSYLISLSKSKVNEFYKRNSHDSNMLNSNNTIWFPAINGYDQSILDEYYNIFQTRRLNVSEFTKGYKFGYNNPHVVGCFMSHWHLIRMALLNWNNMHSSSSGGSSSIRPDALLIFEDDASCAPNTIQTIQNVIPKLPDDWDLLYIGGKPFSKFDGDITNITDHDIQQLLMMVVDVSKHDDDDPTRQKKKSKTTTITLDDSKLFRTLLCDGKLGRSNTGPFVSLDDNGIGDDASSSRYISRAINPNQQDYWKIKYITNTNAYIINPHKIEKILEIIENHPPNHHEIIPIDIKYADSMSQNKLHAYMTTTKLCIQPHFQDTNPPRTIHEEQPFDGYYYHGQIKNLKQFTGKPFWMDMYIENCPGY